MSKAVKKSLPANDAELLQELTQIRSRLFDLANSQAGNERGNVAVLLHAGCNEILRAKQCLERGNPASEPIPIRLLMESMGLTPTMQGNNELH